MAVKGVKTYVQGLPSDVRVAFAGTDAQAEAISALSGQERTRVEGFRHPDRRASFALGRLAARSLLAEVLGADVAAVTLDIAASGAPVVAAAGLFVSIAHAGRGSDVSAVAAVASRPVGVDLELAVPRHPDLLLRLLHSEEAALPTTLDAEPNAAPALIWALKEAVLKGLGTGLRRSARTVSLRPSGPGRVIATDGEGAWEVAYARVGSFWLAVALAERARPRP